VAHAVAELRGVDPTDLPSVDDAVNVDALDALLPERPHDGSGSPSVWFEFAGCRVAVDGGSGGPGRGPRREPGSTPGRQWN
jgi:hypothetical protein